MENASKALLIAAAILIAIILISLGLIAINQGREVIDEAGSGVADIAVSTFNNKFTAYCGTNKAGAEAKALIAAVDTNNKVNSDDDSKQITIVQPKEGIKAGKSYTITVTNTTSGGYVHEITIAETTTK